MYDNNLNNGIGYRIILYFCALLIIKTQDNELLLNTLPE